MNCFVSASSAIVYMLETWPPRKKEKNVPFPFFSSCQASTLYAVHECSELRVSTPTQRRRKSQARRSSVESILESRRTEKLRRTDTLVQGLQRPRATETVRRGTWSAALSQARHNDRRRTQRHSRNQSFANALSSAATKRSAAVDASRCLCEGKQNDAEREPLRLLLRLASSLLHNTPSGITLHSLAIHAKAFDVGNGKFVVEEAAMLTRFKRAQTISLGERKRARAERKAISRLICC